MLQGRAVAAALAGLVALAALVLPVGAGGPVETSPFAVQGVEVDVTSTDANSAKNQALMDVQVKAFFLLVERLGSMELAEQLKEKLKPEDIAPFLRSLSIEKETSGPGRYIGTFTVRFLPAKMQKFLAGYNINVPAQQADPVLVIPVYRAPDGLKLWEDNPWRQAWIDLKGEQGVVPIIIPLGDLEDTEALTAEDAVNGDTVKLDAIRKRYDAASILVAQAQPTETTDLHVYIEGDTKLGHVNINKVYSPEPAEDGTTPPVETTAATAFQKVLYKAYIAQAAKVAEEKAARDNTPQSLAVTVPFSSPREWNAIRSRILNTPNVSGVDLSSLDFNGATIRLVYTHSLEELQGNMQRVGLSLSQGGGGWVIQPM
ncbi:hypothetical protein DK847_17990 [Aestuariivirga litoralis]|uniref:DUF2066 domain-containing protein n=1 Tax=Aestuariivirga litoralis TaxID=2650924 RepID=A0A2W2BGX7_9HYPH|nr:DUF2066 domain-containing protein [Aestuariivirga litoralis]PZF75409.1 hypothetical protein DK847_17990 [Aestuariivirga litoralis]